MGDYVRLPRRSEPRAQPEPLWRLVLGSRLRRLRQHRGLSLTRTAARAGISAQYLSEIERGRKEPSSEVVAAVAGALGYSVLEVATLTVTDLRRSTAGTAVSAPRGPVALAA